MCRASLVGGYKQRREKIFSYKCAFSWQEGITTNKCKGLIHLAWMRKPFTLHSSLPFPSPCIHPFIHLFIHHEIAFQWIWDHNYFWRTWMSLVKIIWNESSQTCKLETWMDEKLLVCEAFPHLWPQHSSPQTLTKGIDHKIMRAPTSLWGIQMPMVMGPQALA